MPVPTPPKNRKVEEKPKHKKPYNKPRDKKVHPPKKAQKNPQMKTFIVELNGLSPWADESPYEIQAESYSAAVLLAEHKFGVIDVNRVTEKDKPKVERAPHLYQVPFRGHEGLQKLKAELEAGK